MNKKILTKAEFLENKEFYLREILAGKIFIYPTDTILGIGCIVDNEESIDGIFDLKKREEKPLLVIVPNIDWIEKNCVISEENKRFVEEKLPGAYSFILELKDKNLLYSKINNKSGSIGVRIPDNWFAKMVSELGEAFITTSVNISGEESVLNIEDIPESMMSGVDYIITDSEERTGKSSRLFDLRGEERNILRK